MAKIKVTLELKELKLHIEGERDAIPQITHGIQKHVAGLLSAADIAAARPVTPVEPDDDGAASLRLSRKRSGGKSGAGRTESAAIDFQHDPLKFGNPTQTWTTAEKAIWLLYVVEQAAGIKEMSAPTIAATFNKHFRQAKEVRGSNVVRDLGNLKTENPSLVGETTTKNPSAWYLTLEGSKAAQNLIKTALKPVAA